MEIIFSRHAKRQMKWREITESDVAGVITLPEKLEESKNNRKNAFKHVGDKFLKVTYILEIDTIIVVTAIDKNK